MGGDCYPTALKKYVKYWPLAPYHGNYWSGLLTSLFPRAQFCSRSDLYLYKVSQFLLIAFYDKELRQLQRQTAVRKCKVDPIEYWKQEKREGKYMDNAHTDLFSRMHFSSALVPRKRDKDTEREREREREGEREKSAMPITSLFRR